METLMEPLSPKQRVFGTLRNLLRLVQQEQDLNAHRERLEVSLDRAISWESQLIDLPD